MEVMETKIKAWLRLNEDNNVIIKGDRQTTYSLKELSEQEIEDFFDKDWKTVECWSEGQGRSQTYYEIMHVFRTTIISMQDYGFDDFHQTKYFLIN